MAKIFEKFLAYRIINYLNNYNVLTPNQFGFTEGKNTEVAILELLNRINQYIDNKIPTKYIFIDLGKEYQFFSQAQLLDV